MGAIPSSTRHHSSNGFSPCGVIPASVPAAIGTFRSIARAMFSLAIAFQRSFFW